MKKPDIKRYLITLKITDHLSKSELNHTKVCLVPLEGDWQDRKEAWKKISDWFEEVFETIADEHHKQMDERSNEKETSIENDANALAAIARQDGHNVNLLKNK